MRGLLAKGFTLVEVLVALFISVLVLTSVLGSLDYTQRAVDAIHNIIETEAAGPRILEQIRRDLGHIVPVDNAEFTAFLGEDDSIAGADADRMDFIAFGRSTVPFHDLTRDEMVWAPINEIGYALRQHPQFPEFLELYRREDFLVDEKPMEEGSFSLLYDRIINFNVVYFAEPELEPAWEDDWNSAEREALPYALEIRMDLEVQPRRSSESLMILGANRARLSFEDVYAFPSETRWIFRNRLHPMVPGSSGDGSPGEGEDEDGTDTDPGLDPGQFGGIENFGGGRGGGGGDGRDFRTGGGSRDEN